MESSGVVSVGLPPPPPPPPPMLNMNATNNNGRSQLLADIRKGATLKKAPVLNDSNQNELSPNEKLKKQTQDLLQAELTSTLKRRKPVVINEPPKYEYPTYDEDSYKTNESSHSTSNANNANTTTIVTKPLNVNAVLSVVSGIKIPDVQYDANTTNATKSQSNDKPKITHGRPNFTITPLKECKSNDLKLNGQSPSPKVPIKSPEIKAQKFHRPSYFTSTLTTLDKSSANKSSISAEPSNAESQVEKCKSIFLIKSQKSVENDSPNSQKQSQHQKIEAISKVECPTVPLASFSPPLTRLASVPEQRNEIKKKNSMDETQNVSVANKKAIFEKPVASIPKTNGVKNTQSNKVISNKSTSNHISNGKYSTLNSPRIISQANNQSKPGITTVALNKNPSFGSLGRPPAPVVPAIKDRVDHHFERTVHTVNETTTTNGKYETKQFEQKTFVSFSKDLLNAPNKYPDQIRVKKTIVTERSHAINQDNPFNNIRFSIQANGQVIPKPK